MRRVLTLVALCVLVSLAVTAAAFLVTRSVRIRSLGSGETAPDVHSDEEAGA